MQQQISLKQIKKFEEKNNLSVNVYTIFEEEEAEEENIDGASVANVAATDSDDDDNFG